MQNLKNAPVVAKLCKYRDCNEITPRTYHTRSYVSDLEKLLHQPFHPLSPRSYRQSHKELQWKTKCIHSGSGCFFNFSPSPLLPFNAHGYLFFDRGVILPYREGNKHRVLQCPRGRLIWFDPTTTTPYQLYQMSFSKLEIVVVLHLSAFKKGPARMKCMRLRWFIKKVSEFLG